MKRKFIKELEYWRENNIKMPLLVIGARQIGKTYIINEFCTKNYKEYIYLNFEHTPKIVEFFENNLDPKEIIRNIEILTGKKVIPGETIIFFDEIQISEKAITSLKYFCESEINYKIICAGSLLGVKLHRFNSSFPVGKVRILEMHSMDFEEFLWANEEEALASAIIESYKNKRPLLDIFHEKALKYYNDYLLIGGMPQAILNYITTKNIIDFDRNIHTSIITAYLADMRKYTTSSAESIKINDVYESIPRQLAKENTKFKYSIVDKYANKRDYDLPLDWLLASGMIYKSQKIESVKTPLKAYVNNRNFKIYLNDIGLLASLADVSSKDILFNEDNIFKGALTENYVAQSLKANQKELYYFKPNQNMEIDFLINLNDSIIPIEVKAGTHTRSRSLNNYIEKYRAEYAIRISAKNFGMSENIFSVPLYAVFCIK